MLPRNDPDRLQFAFDDPGWWPMLDWCCHSRSPATWVWVIWWIATLTWRMRRRGQTRADKMLTPVALALAGGDCIDDADVLRTGRTGRVLGYTVKAQSTPCLRGGRLWGPSFAASAGAMCDSWTG